MWAGSLVWTIYGLAFFSYFYLATIVVNISDRLVVAPVWIALPHLVTYAVTGAVAGPLTWLVMNRIFRALPADRAPDAGRQVVAAATASVILTIMVAVTFWSASASRDWILFAVGVLLLAGVLAYAWQSRRGRWLATIGDPWIACFILAGIPWAWTRFAIPRVRTYLIVAVVVVLGWAIVSAVARVTIDRMVGRAHWGPLARRSLVFAGGLLAAAAIALGGNRLLAAGPGELPPATSQASGPDVVLIVMDTVRADHLPIYGYSRDTTPFLRRLAERATVYTRAVAASNMTLTSHASLFTGQYPRRHGAHFLLPEAPKGRPVPESTDTMAELLASAGYRTAAIVANHWYLDAAWGMAQGFQVYDDRPYIGIGAAGNAGLLDSVIARVAPWAFPKESWRDFRRGDRITRDALTQLDELAAGGSPFFLFLNYMDAHHPWVPPPPYDTLFPGGNPQYTLFHFDRIRREIVSGKRDVAPAERDAMMAEYDGGLAYVDRQIETVVSRLAELGRLDNTLFIVTSDHGEGFGGHDIIGHGKTTAVSQTSVPLLVKYPQQQSGRRVDVLASHVDLLPTVLAATGLQAPAEIDGLNLASIETHSDRFVVAEAYRNPFFIRIGAAVGMAETSVYLGTLKLVFRETGEQRLFDLSADPLETRDLSAAAPDMAAALGTRLDRWLARMPAAPGNKPDQATLDRLKSLGYVR